jgi:hypothetical protein
LSNDSDADASDELTVTDARVLGDGSGTVAITEGGTLRFDPGAGYQSLGVGETATVEVEYTVSDGSGGTSVATATVVVEGTNDGPVASDVSLQTDEDNAVTFSADDLLANVSDIDGDALSIVNIDTPENGTLVDNGDGTYTFTPDENFSGEAEFTYTVSDGEGGTATASATIDVTPVADAPDVTVSVSEAGSSVEAQVPTDGMVFRLSANSIAGDGVATADGATIDRWEDISGNNADAVTSQGSPNFEADSTNGNGGVDFDSGDGMSIANSAAINTGSYTEKSFAFTIETGESVDGFQVIYEQGGGTRGYSLSIAPDAETGDPKLFAFVWNKAEWPNGDQYKVIDLGTVEPNTAYSAAMVHDANDGTGTFTGYLNGEQIGQATNVAFQRPHAGVVGVGTNNGGTVHPVTLQNVNASNAGDFLGSISEAFSWNAALTSDDIAGLMKHMADEWGTPDGQETVSYDLTITVSPTDPSETLSDIVIDLSNAPDGAVLTAGSDNGDGTWTVSEGDLADLRLEVSGEAASDFDLTVSVTSVESNGETATTTQTVSVEAPDVNEAPVAAGDTITTTEDQPITFTAADLLSNDTDADGDTLTIVDVIGPADGSLVDHGDGTYTFTPDENWSGEATFTYTASDPDGETSTATVTIDVTPVADAPTLVVSAVTNEPAPAVTAVAVPAAITQAATGGTQIVIDGVPDGASLSSGTDNGNGTWTVDAADLSDLSITPANGASGSVDLAFTVQSFGEDVLESDTFSGTEDGWSGSVRDVNGKLEIDYNDTATKTFDFGSEHAGQTVVITIDSETYGGWESSGVSQDYFRVTANGTEVLETSTLGASSNAVTVVLDGNGRVTLEMAVDATASDEGVYVDSVSIAAGDDFPIAVADDSATTTYDMMTAVDLDITAQLTDQTESLSAVVINLSDAPDGAMLSAGTDNGDGTWTVAADALSGLTLSAPSGAPSFDIEIVVASEESDGTSATTTRAITVEMPEIDAVTIEDPGVYDYTGGDGDDWRQGRGGNDVMFGGDGGDTLYGDRDYYKSGEANDDTLFGGDGDDQLYGGGGDDQIDGGDGADVIHGDLNYDHADSGADTVSGGAGDDTIYGNSGADTLGGGSGDDVVHGDFSGFYSDGDGGDVIYGDGGADTLYGGGGDDSLFGGSGDDTIIGGVAGDEDGSWNDSRAGDDYLDGGAGHDTLHGGYGDDTLVGGQGDDVLDGGRGDDLFIFGAGDGSDSISGGQGWLDTIHLEDVAGGPSDGGWALELDSGTIEEQASDYVRLSDGASGSITFDDGSQIDFDGIERIEW